MGLTNSSTGRKCFEEEVKIEKRMIDDKVIALAGNPNVGKSTVFNNLTGLNQHTGNWPGKTVSNAQGFYTHKNKRFILIDIPGTYSLMANSVEEEVARDFICFGNPDVTVVVVDATCLERNLNLVLQTLEITSKVVVCVNLMDEAKRKNININLKELEIQLGVPVVGTNANKGKGLKELMDKVYDIAYGNYITNPINIRYDDTIEKSISDIEKILTMICINKINSRWVAMKLIDDNDSFIKTISKYMDFDLTTHNELMNQVALTKEQLNNDFIDPDKFRDMIVSKLVSITEDISSKVVIFKDDNYDVKNRKIDKYLTSKIFGIPVMIGLLGFIFFLTITGANIPSKILADLLFWVQDRLTDFFTWLNTPMWIHDVLVLGVYRTVAWVISVMLPPMAIFFPLFTLMEDLGYLPRIAFNLDRLFKRCCACGKQALTMCMGFGCNAAGVIGCRIIDSPRERLIAIITNNFVPCNGRFPALIAIITMFFTGVISSPLQPLISTIILTVVIILGVVMTLLISKLLSKTFLKGIPSTFTLELPPYRKPQIGKVIIRSIFDRTLFVLGRAVAVAAPAGLIIWVMANVNIGSLSILTHCANFFDPFAQHIGLDGYILMAFILGFPANEIVVPIIIMSYMATGNIIEINSLTALKDLLVDHGWTWLTAVCVMLFSLMHWPCGTTCWTIKKETQSLKWTLASILIPTVVGMTICFVITTSVHLLKLL